MYRAKLENGTTVECSSFGDMLEKAYKLGQRVVDYEVIGRKAKKSGKNAK